MSTRPHFLQPGLRQAPSGLRLAVRGQEDPLATIVELAVDSASRRRGLLGRPELPPGTAVIIAPSSAVHTFGMRFDIDIIFAARDGRVLKIRSSVPRSRIAVSLRAFAVIEMAAGSAQRRGLQPGDQLSLVVAE